MYSDTLRPPMSLKNMGLKTHYQKRCNLTTDNVKLIKTGVLQEKHMLLADRNIVKGRQTSGPMTEVALKCWPILKMTQQNICM